MSIRKIFALTLFAAIAVSSAALAQGGGGGGGGGAGGGGAGGASSGAAGGCQWRWWSSRHNWRSNNGRPQCGYDDRQRRELERYRSTPRQ